MKRTLGWLTVLLVVVLVGCKSTGGGGDTQSPWGETYLDVVVPDYYEAFHTPPFKRQDGADGKRIFGRYAYKSGKGLDRPSRLAAWFEAELPHQGWTHQISEVVDDEKGLMTVRFLKGEDQLVLKLQPDKLVRSNERFSVLIVEMNPQFGN